MDDDYAIIEDLRRRIAASPFHAGLGISIEHAAAGDVRLGWEARPDHRNLQGGRAGSKPPARSSAGSQVGFAEGSVTDATGRLLVRANGTYSVTQERTDAATG